MVALADKLAADRIVPRMLWINGGVTTAAKLSVLRQHLWFRSGVED